MAWLSDNPFTFRLEQHKTNPVPSVPLSKAESHNNILAQTLCWNQCVNKTPVQYGFCGQKLNKMSKDVCQALKILFIFLLQCNHGFKNIMCVLREKDKLKEREEAWMKIDELARRNPDVSIPSSRQIDNRFFFLKGTVFRLVYCLFKISREHFVLK